MTTYYEAYDKDNRQVLGNLDGQGIHKGPKYHRTKHYKALRYGSNRPKWPKIKYWLVIRNEAIIDKIKNVHFNMEQD